MTDYRSLKSKHFVFFGGTSGIGQAAAEAVASEGAFIAVVGRDPTAGENTVKQLETRGAASATFIRGDLSSVRGAKHAAMEVQRWSKKIDGIVHSAMSAFSGKRITNDGLEFAFALQYQARVVIDNLLLDNLAASGDGRIIHLAGAVPQFVVPDLDDLQFERTPFSFWKALLGSNNLGFMFIQEAGNKWQGRSVSLVAACVGTTKTKAMQDPGMPFLMRFMAKFGTTPEISARNIVQYLRLKTIPKEEKFGIMWNSKRLVISKPTQPQDKASKLWKITSQISEDRGVPLPAMDGTSKSGMSMTVHDKL
ncbi:NAD(P)-binding protein [Aureobasidium namibiae CBS 147.97]|uniref:NAD(P)-binding protein n=1 Tax=Aureobasidium namibiae CBS 147.97 TaxID=1043004 RepID=A0A074WDZ7_9PEZI